MIKNQNKIIVIITILSFVVPFYESESGKSAMQLLEMSYAEVVVFTFVTLASCCLLGHVIWTAQDKTYMKPLIKKKKRLENELQSYD